MGVLDGKVAIVTGAGRGIGRGIALGLARAGADVVVNYRHSATGAEEVVAQAVAEGRRAIAVQADVSNAVDRARLIDAAIHELGGLDILVNNSGITIPRPFLEVDEELWDRTHSINLKGMFFLAQAAACYMVEHGIRGRIINLSSVQGGFAVPQHAHYAATKGGIDSMTRVMALELAPYGITVNAVAPGVVEVERYWDSPGYSPERFGPTIPIGRVGKPEDVAGLVVYLCSDAADWMTGQVIYLDGGTTAQLAWNPPPDVSPPRTE
ncbi:MAG TPA: 3-oxoacyl-ACP reductase FabG [Caldilineae bacterium]|nr:3-oxoacyl-ACP reductase FabG [Caldilineae bacterium]